MYQICTKSVPNLYQILYQNQTANHPMTQRWMEDAGNTNQNDTSTNSVTLVGSSSIDDVDDENWDSHQHSLGNRSHMSHHPFAASASSSSSSTLSRSKSNMVDIFDDPLTKSLTDSYSSSGVAAIVATTHKSQSSTVKKPRSGKRLQLFHPNEDLLELNRVETIDDDSNGNLTGDVADAPTDVDTASDQEDINSRAKLDSSVIVVSDGEVDDAMQSRRRRKRKRQEIPVDLTVEDFSEGICATCGEKGFVSCPSRAHWYCQTCFDNMVSAQITPGSAALTFICMFDECKDIPFKIEYVYKNVSETILSKIRKLEQDTAIKRALDEERERLVKSAEEEAKKSETERQIDSIRLKIESAAERRCPGCKNAYLDFDGCMAVTCKCGANFCGFCEEKFDSTNTSHAHVMQCKYNPKKGSYHCDKQAWEKANRQCKAKNLKVIMDELNPNIRQLAEENKSIATILREHGLLAAPLHCTRGHPLIERKTKTTIADACKGCGEVIPKGSNVHWCSRCKYSICKTCHQANTQHEAPAVQAVPFVEPAIPALQIPLQQPQAGQFGLLNHMDFLFGGFGGLFGGGNGGLHNLVQANAAEAAAARQRRLRRQLE